MYPIDLLKVCMLRNGWPGDEMLTLCCASDTNASRQSHSRGGVHRHWQCDSDHFKSGGVYVVMEGSIKCGVGSR